MARSFARPTFLFAAGATIAGCGLMYDYSDYADAPSIGGGGTATATTTTTTSLGGGGSGATGGTGTATTTTTTGGTGGTGGSGGTGGTGGSGGTGGTGGSGGTGPEICLDGIDNDDDGLTDCEDTEDCATDEYLCAPLPEGDSWGNWSSPFLAFAGVNPPGCIGQFDTDVPFATNTKFLFVTDPPADVCECGCENPTAQGCDNTTVTLRVRDDTVASCDPNDGCGSVVDRYVNAGSSSCTSIKGAQCAAPLATEVLNVSLPILPAECAATPRVASGALPPAFWLDAEDRLCSSDIGVCSETGFESRCIPTPPGTEFLRVCVAQQYQSGLTCPGPYSDEVMLFPPAATFTDTRHCINDGVDPCDCSRFDVKCGGWVQVFRDPTCTALAEQKEMPPETAMCAISTVEPHAKWIPHGNDPGDWTPLNAGDHCNPSGTSVFTGTVTPTGAPPAVLMCCLPDNG